jgi:AcrR family transcriptional regulator
LSDTATVTPRPVGRPPRIDRQAIADAVLEIGLSRASMKAVAEHLGVSVGGLYHHVRNRSELLMLAAERSLGAVELPEDRGQHWAEWLREWGRYSRNAFVEQPAVFEQFLAGAVAAERVVEVSDSVIQVLTRQGFTPREALAAWDAVGRLALGAAAESVRQSAAARSGRSLAAEWQRVLGMLPPDALPGARAISSEALWDLEAAFEEELTTLLIGVAVRRGEPWEPVAAADDAQT